ncbi:MAG: ABC transporter substrate-binding protein [Clostridia bacterium]|nr:ABC transporter substrate-binding protein [Clostridia bacterium]
MEKYTNLLAWIIITTLILTSGCGSKESNKRNAQSESKIEQTTQTETAKKEEQTKETEQPKQTEASNKEEQPKQTEAAKKEEQPKKTEAAKKEEQPKQTEKPQKQEQTQQKASAYPLTIKDDAGRTVVLEQIPKRIAAISGTFLGILYAAGGKSIARCDASGGSPLPEGTNELPSLGHVSNPDMEKLISLQPDFVILQRGIHDKFTQVLEASKIPVIVLQMKTYDEVVSKLKLFGDICNTADKVKPLIDTMEKKINEIVSKLPAKPKKVVILYATSQDVSVKLDNSIAGNVAQILKIKNIATGMKPDKMGSESTPFSMEKIVESDPDVILVTTMVSSREIAEERIKKDLESNPAWSELRAVKEKRIVYLPQSHFLYNPGERFHEAVEYMAKAVYPEVYGNVSN